MRLVRCLLLVATLAALSACGNLFVSHQPTLLLYELRAPPAVAAPTRLEATLVVARPLARPGLDTDRIVVRLADHRVDSYAGARWSAPLPDMLQALLLDTLRASGGWQAVSSDRAEFSGRQLLQPEIREFVADYTGGAGPPTVRVTLIATLGTSSGTQPTANLEAHAEVVASADRQREVIAAFQSACERATVALQEAVHAAAR